MCSRQLSRLPRTANKYEYGHDLNVFVLDPTLHSLVHFSGEDGFVPKTIAPDGEPLDILLLAARQPLSDASLRCV
jgi:inorganic pyrophosphatase